MTEPVIIGRATLYLGDCREVLPALEPADAIVTDPPYGIGAGKMSFGKWRTSRMPDEDWDDTAADLRPLLALERPSVIFGGNYYLLPPARCFLVWNKGAGFRGRDFAECEMAWTNFDAVARVFTYDPLAGGDYRDKQHPTQKPVAVMKWAISHVPPPAETILDPFMGSGSTGVAAVQMGRSFIGIEREQHYFDVACHRLEQAQRQGDFFVGEAA